MTSMTSTVSQRSLLVKGFLFVCDDRAIVCHDVAAAPGSNVAALVPFVVRAGRSSPIALWMLADALTARAAYTCGAIADFTVADGVVRRLIETGVAAVEWASPWANDDTVALLTPAGVLSAYSISGCAAVPRCTPASKVVAVVGPDVVSVSADGMSLVVSASRGGDRVVGMPTSKPIVALCAHPTQPVVAAAGADGMVFVVTLGLKDAVFAKRWHSRGLAAMAWGPHDATTLLTGGEEGVLCTWSTVTYKVSTLAHLPGALRSISFGATDPTQVSVVLSSTRAVIVDTTSNKVAREVLGVCWAGDGARFRGIAPAPFLGRGCVAAFSGPRDEVRIHDPVTGRTAWCLQSTSSVNAVSPIDEASFAPRITVESLCVLRHGHRDHVVVVDRSSVATQGAARTALRFFHYDAAAHDVVRNTVVHDPHATTGSSSSRPVALAAHPTDGVVVSGGPSETKVWGLADADTTDPYWTCLGVRFEGIREAVFSHDGSLLAALDGNGLNVRLHDVASMRRGGAWVVAAVLATPGPAAHLRMLRDDAAVAVATADGTVHVWDLLVAGAPPKGIATGRAVRRMWPHPTGALLVLGVDGGMSVVDVAKGKVTAAVKAEAPAAVDFAVTEGGAVVTLLDAAHGVLGVWAHPMMPCTPRPATSGGAAAPSRKSPGLTPLLSVPAARALHDESLRGLTDGMGALGLRVSALLEGPTHELPAMSSVLRALLGSLN